MDEAAASLFASGVSPSVARRLVAVFWSAARTAVMGYDRVLLAAPPHLRRCAVEPGTGLSPRAASSAWRSKAAAPAVVGLEKLVPDTLMKRAGSLIVPPPVDAPPAAIVPP
jgi:hypothetical protein